MITLLVCASLLLHVLSFIAIRTIQSNVQQQESRHQKDKQAYESMLSSILEELREENDRLLQAEPKSRETHTKPSEKRTLEPVAEEDTAPVSDYTPPQPVEEEDQVSMSNLGRVLQLHEQGRASAEIAKQLGMGKTEVELILLMKKNGENKRKS